MAKVLGKPSADDVKRVAVAALVAALGDGKEKARKNPRLTGMRAMATGAVLYTAGRAVIGGRRVINDRLNDSRAEEYEDEPAAEADEDFDDEDEPEEDEPEAEADEDFEDEEPEEEEDFDEEDEEPEAEEDEDFEDEEPEEDEDFDEEDEEPEAEADEDFDDEDEFDEDD